MKQLRTISAILLIAAVAEAQNILTVKPEGGGDYTTLAAWWSANKSASDPAQWAECYGTGDLGIVVWEPTAQSGTPNITNYSRIYAATGHRHNGMNASTGAYIYVANGNEGIDIAGTRDAPYRRVSGIRFDLQAGASTTRGIDVSGRADLMTVEDCLFREVGTTNSGQLEMMSYKNSGIDWTGGTVRNTICYGNSSAARGIHLFISSSGKFMRGMRIENCSTYNCGAGGITYGAASGALASTADLVNCVAILSTPTNDFGFHSLGKDYWTITQTYCVSSDSTSTNFGGAGNVTGQTAAACFASLTNLLPKAGGPLVDTGTTVSGYTNDAIGTTRPSGSAWDIGALELFQAPGGAGQVGRRRFGSFGGSMGL